MAADLGKLDKRAQKAIGGTLDSTETVLAAQPGEKAALVATNRRILICKWGVTSGSMFGSQVNSWDFAHVTGIEYRKGMTTKAIVVQTAGAQVVTKFGRMDSGPMSVWEAPNALFTSGNAGEATVTALRQMIADFHQPLASSVQPGTMAESDPAEQVRKFASLRDDGIISEEEFAAKKRLILGI